MKVDTLLRGEHLTYVAPYVERVGNMWGVRYIARGKHGESAHVRKFISRHIAVEWANVASKAVKHV